MNVRKLKYYSRFLQGISKRTLSYFLIYCTTYMQATRRLRTDYFRFSHYTTSYKFFIADFYANILISMCHLCFNVYNLEYPSYALYVCVMQRERNSRLASGRARSTWKPLPSPARMLSRCSRRSRNESRTS